MIARFRLNLDLHAAGLLLGALACASADSPPEQRADVPAWGGSAATPEEGTAPELGAAGAAPVAADPASSADATATPASNSSTEGTPPLTAPVAAAGADGNAAAMADGDPVGMADGNPGGPDDGKALPCDFASGLNVAWVRFANDVPNPDLNAFNTIFKNAHDAGGRVVRWWFHTNGTVTPGYNADGTVRMIQQSHIDGVKAILAAAHAAGVAVNISLWSFDMAQDNAAGAAARNRDLMTQDNLRQSYADNYLTPLVTALKGTPGLYSYEIFNEPEGMSTTGWATQWKIDISYIQKAVNQWAAAIHAADPTVLVTNGSQTMDYRTRYTDSALTAAGGQPSGTLDFYQVHFYQSNGQGNNVFANERSHWGLSDKPLVIGEFSIDGTAPVSGDQSYAYLYEHGYDGAWAWAYTADDKWPSMQAPMQALYSAHSDVGSCP
ncbi:MAG TPA: hypothetical protein VFS67_26310 [Polyangiaceae bacterium]|nr:hypothetical protein [Polyangiaceae bacterium]